MEFGFIYRQADMQLMDQRWHEFSHTDPRVPLSTERSRLHSASSRIIPQRCAALA